MNRLIGFVMPYPNVAFFCAHRKKHEPDHFITEGQPMAVVDDGLGRVFFSCEEHARGLPQQEMSNDPEGHRIPGVY
jgi:hypothetical protein